MCFYMVYCTAVSLRFVLYVEVAVNGMFGAGQGGMINPPDPDRHCSLSLSEIAVFDQEVYDLIMDLTILYDMTKVTLAPSICMTNIYFQWFCSRRNVFCKGLIRGFDNVFLSSSVWLYLLFQYLPCESSRAYEALYTANEIVTICDPFDKSTFQR